VSLRIAANINTRPVDLFVDYLDAINDIVDDVGREVFEDYRPVVLQRLQADPGPVKYPIQWTTEKQRRAFFATNGFGQGIPTVRTGAIQEAWDMEMIHDPGAFRILIVNRNPKAKWLYGGLSLRSNPRFQQQMHKNTGWEAAAPVIDIYLDAMRTEFVDRMRQELVDFASVTGSGRRAYTSR
jgi:hypothetical protein